MCFYIWVTCDAQCFTMCCNFFFFCLFFWKHFKFFVSLSWSLFCIYIVNSNLISRLRLVWSTTELLYESNCCDPYASQMVMSLHSNLLLIEQFCKSSFFGLHISWKRQNNLIFGGEKFFWAFGKAEQKKELQSFSKLGQKKCLPTFLLFFVKMWASLRTRN